MAAHHLAKGLAALGRNGDSMLVHMQPHEVAGLQAIAKIQGKSLTTNPHTGLPEAFDLGSFFTSFLPLAAGIALAPETGGASLGLTGTAAQAAPIVGGALTGAGVSAMKGEDPFLGGFMGGLGGYGGSQIGSSLANFGGAGAAASEGLPSAATVAENPAGFQAAANINSGLPVTSAANQFETSMGLPLTSATEAQAGVAAGPATGTNYLAQGAQRAMQNPGDYIQSVGGNMAAAKMYGMPLVGAGLAGLEQSDIYGDPITAPHKKIPTLNLSDANYPGLNLNTNYAAGGVIDPSVDSANAGGLAGLYSTQDGTPQQDTPAEGYGLGRLQAMSQGGVPTYAKGGYLDGPGDGMSDSIPATIEGKQPARLADGEFVVPADVVSHLGNGSTKAGSQRLYGMLDKVRKARTGTAKQGKQINPNKYMPA
jgi:hypothetical protein